jgi:hypothetical protein
MIFRTLLVDVRYYNLKWLSIKERRDKVISGALTIFSGKMKNEL